MAAAALRTAARHLAAPAAVCGALASIAPPQRTSCNEHDERLANLKAEVMLLRGENARLRRALDGGSLDVEALRLRIADFARERDWDQFHTPRNILLAPVHKSTDTPSSRRRVDGVRTCRKIWFPHRLALVGEVGELAECFQWKGEVARNLPEFSEPEKIHVGEELADVLIYTVRLADVCGIALDDCVPRKIAMNARKYPADRARGRSDKYTAYSAKS